MKVVYNQETRRFTSIPSEPKNIRVLGLNTIVKEVVVDKVYRAKTNREALELAKRDYPELTKAKAFGPDGDKSYNAYKKELTAPRINLDNLFK